MPAHTRLRFPPYLCTREEKQVSGSLVDAAGGGKFSAIKAPVYLYVHRLDRVLQRERDTHRSEKYPVTFTGHGAGHRNANETAFAAE